jgi:hypothetical protein
MNGTQETDCCQLSLIVQAARHLLLVLAPNPSRQLARLAESAVPDLSLAPAAAAAAAVVGLLFQLQAQKNQSWTRDLNAR